MNAQGLVVHPPNYYYVRTREDYLIVSKQLIANEKDKCRASPYCMAKILEVMEHWTNSKRGKGRSLWVTMTYEQFSDAMYGEYGRLTIRDSLALLLKRELLKRESVQINEKGTFRYELQYKGVNELLAALPVRTHEDLAPTGDYEEPEEDTASQMRSSPQPASQMRRGQVSKEIRSEHNQVSNETLHRLDRLNNIDRGGLAATSSPVADPVPSPPPVSSSSSSQQKKVIALLDWWDSYIGYKDARTNFVRQAAAELVRIEAMTEDIVLVCEDILKSHPGQAINLDDVCKQWKRLKTIKQRKQVTSLNIVPPPLARDDEPLTSRALARKHNQQRKRA